MGVGEVDEILRREEKRRKKRKARLVARQIRKERAQTLWKGVVGAFGYDHRRAREAQAMSGAEGEHHLGSDNEGRREGRGLPRSPSVCTGQRSVNSSSGYPDSPDPSTMGSMNVVFRKLNQFTAGRQLCAWYFRLRHAHLTASRVQAEETVERIQQVYGRDGGEVTGSEVVDPGTIGWGLGSYGIRQVRDDGQTAEGLRGILEVEEEDRDSETSSLGLGNERKQEGSFDEHSIKTRRRRNRTSRRDTDTRSEGTLPQHMPVEDTPPPASMWYWGPLRRWRLRDSTVYS